MPDAQQLLTLAIVVAAAGYLVRRTWKRLSGRPVGGCGSCSRCAGLADDRSPAAKSLIPVETSIASASRKTLTFGPSPAHNAPKVAATRAASLAGRSAHPGTCAYGYTSHGQILAPGRHSPSTAPSPQSLPARWPSRPAPQRQPTGTRFRRVSRIQSRLSQRCRIKIAGATSFVSM